MTQSSTQDNTYGYFLSFRYYLLPLIVLATSVCCYGCLRYASGLTRVVGSLLLATTSIAFSYQFYEQCLRAPRTLTVDGHRLIAKMFFGKVVTIDILSINRLVSSEWRSLLSSFPISIISESSERLVIGRDLRNLSRFLETIQHLNPNCRIQPKILRSVLNRSKK